MEYTAEYSSDPHKLQATVSKQIPQNKLYQPPRQFQRRSRGTFITSLFHCFVAFVASSSGQAHAISPQLTVKQKGAPHQP
jgi:hypothetical protein